MTGGRARGLLWLVIGLSPLLAGFDLLRSANRAVNEGNAALKAGKPAEALQRYDRALAELPGDPGVRFNRGAALFDLGRFDEATQEFLRATEARTPALKAQSFLNLGNSFFQSGKFNEAIEAYKRSLTLEPSDVRAKWNLELALKKRAEQKQRDDSQKDQDGKKSDQNKSDQNKSDQDRTNQQGQDGGRPDDPSRTFDGGPSEQDPPSGQGTHDAGPEPTPPTLADAGTPPASDDATGSPSPAPAEPRRADAGAPGPGATAGDKAQRPGGATPEDQREIDAILDSLERSPKALEQERARLRAVRRQPPAKDW